MKLADKEEFLRESSAALSEIYDLLLKLPDLKLKGLNKKNTALIIVDMVNGFAREGALMSPRIEALIPEITRLSQECGKLGIKKIAFADCHSKEAPEFAAYPEHCVCGTPEIEIVDEIKKCGGYELIFKNSTNGFVEEDFHEWLEENEKVTDFIIKPFSITGASWIFSYICCNK